MTELSSIRFSVFELDLKAGELRRNGSKVRLQEQPFQILVSLLERPGKVVTRDELREKLWPGNTFIDFDHGLNAAIRRLREALDDSAETPRFVETVARRGYRFIAPVDIPYAPAVESSKQVPDTALSADQTMQPVRVAVLAVAKQHKFLVGEGILAILVVLSAAGYGVYSLLHHPAPTPFEKFTIMQVTNTGKAMRAALSPDGKYVLSVMGDNGLESVWLRNVATGSDTQVIQPSASHYESLTFSPDGNYFYFRKAQNLTHPPYYNLYRSPILGGAPQMVVENIDSDITFSRDGQRIAYVRCPEGGTYHILTASLEGNDEKVLKIEPTWEYPTSLAWSPKADEIAYSLPNVAGGGNGLIDILDIGTGKSHRLVAFKDKIAGSIRWLPDGQTLLANYHFRGSRWWLEQIGFLRSTEGDIQPITRDTNAYGTLTLSADGKTLATVQTRRYATISGLSKAGPEFGEPRPILSQSEGYNGFTSLTWAAGRNLLVNNPGQLFKLGADGRSQTRLLEDPGAVIGKPVPCGTSYYVLDWVYHGGTKTSNIWRVSVDGSRPMKLTDGLWDDSPICSADQKWVYYIDAGGEHISRVPLDGSGKAEAIFGFPEGYHLLSDVAGDYLDVSPEGNRLAISIERGKKEAAKIAVYDIGSSTPPRMLNAGNFSGQGLQFTPDGKSIAYAIRDNSVDNVWAQPLDGSEGHAITNFKADQIWSFSLSPDGKNLAVLRGHYDSDVVLLH